MGAGDYYQVISLTPQLQNFAHPSLDVASMEVCRLKICRLYPLREIGQITGWICFIRFSFAKNPFKCPLFGKIVGFCLLYFFLRRSWIWINYSRTSDLHPLCCCFLYSNAHSSLLLDVYLHYIHVLNCSNKL